MLNIGDRYTKNGFTVIIHDISGGLVYCEKRLSHNSGKEWPQDDEHDGNSGLYKMPVADFKKQIIP